MGWHPSRDGCSLGVQVEAVVALLNENLSVWELGFRWDGTAPPLLPAVARFPLAAKDRFRLLIGAIYSMHLACMTLSTEKWTPDSKLPPEFFIRHHLRSIDECISGTRFRRKFLKFALVDRWDCYLWCRRQGIPLPEFWFPAGWKLTYEWPDEPQVYDINGVPVLEETRDLVREPYAHRTSSGLTDEFVMIRDGQPVAADAGGEPQLRHNQRARAACQFVAEGLWRQSPATTIADMVKHEAIQKYCDGQCYDEATVRDWIKVVAPASVREKRGRPRKQRSADED